MRRLVDMVDDLLGLLIVAAILIAWLFGLVLASGFWQTLAALFPPFALYLVVERIARAWGLT